MKTPEEIKQRLELCREESGTCEGCPYFNDEHCISHGNLDGLVYINQLEAELEQVKAERDRYWNWIKSMGCETCSGDCGKCDGTSGWTWSGEDYNVK